MMPSWWSAAAAASGVRTTGAARAFIACLLAMSWFAISPVCAQGPVSIAPLAERLGDAVVNISTSQRAKGPSGAPLPHVPRGSPFEDLFEDFFQRKGKKAPGSRRITSLGSGFVIDGKAGLIVTNNHVIADSDEITINFRDGTQLKVDKIVGRDPKTDLALLKVTPKKPLKQVSFGSSDKIRVGDWVLAIGNPFGLGGSVTIGIISAKQRDIHSGPYDDYLQTDAAINKGNSGGPLFNMNGEVIGVNTAIISPGKSGGSIGIGFAIPSSVVVSIIDQLRQFGEIRRGWLGVNIQSVTENLAASLGVPANTGALISKVTKDGPAAKGGIAAGDVIVRFDGKTVENMRALPRIVARTPYGKTVEVEVMRKGKPVKLSILVGRLDEKPAGKTDGANKGNQKSGEALKTYSLAGMTVELLGDAQRKAFKLGEKLKGLVVTKVEKGSPAARADIAAGQVIIETNITKALASVNDLADAIETARKANKRNLRVTLDDGKGNVRFVALPLR